MYYPLKIAEQAKEDSPERILEQIRKMNHCSDDATVDDLYEYIYSFNFFKPTYKGKFEEYNKFIMFDKDINKIYFPMYSMMQFEERSTEWKDVISTSMAVNLWSKYKMVYKIDNDFFHEIKQTEDLVTTKDTFENLPFNCFYIDLSEVKNISDFTGAWIYVTKDKNNGFFGINIYMIAQNQDTFYTYYAWYNFNEKPEVKWNVKDLPESEFTQRSFTEDGDMLFDETIIRKDYDPRNDIVIAIFQIMSFIAIDASDVSESLTTKKTYSAPSKDKEVKNTFSEVRMWDVGIRYGKAIKVAKQQFKKNLRKYNVSNKERKPMRPHIRRAHWQRYHTGKGRQIIKEMWIAPVYVCGDGKEIPVTIREIKK
jgi:hypothetical protein